MTGDSPWPTQPFADPDELLFRWLLRSWTNNGHVLPESIHWPAVCADRALLSTADETYGRGKEQTGHEVGVAKIRVEDTRHSFAAPVKGAHAFFTVPEHCPENGNDAHTEIRSYRCGTPPVLQRPGNTIKAEAKRAIAMRMVIVIPPATDDDEF